MARSRVGGSYSHQVSGLLVLPPKVSKECNQSKPHYLRNPEWIVRTGGPGIVQMEESNNHPSCGEARGAKDTDMHTGLTTLVGTINCLRREKGGRKRKKITFVFVFRKESDITQAGLKLHSNEDDLGHFISCLHP